MEANERKISQVLTEQARYQIPPYQRPYSWEVDNVTQLLEDVWTAYEAEDEEYFIGSLITIELKKDILYDVVDGQQRLTTLNLILAKLRDHIKDGAAKSKVGSHILPRNELTDEAEKPRLNLREKDQSFFHRHVLCSEEITAAIAQKIEKEKDAPKIRIFENLAEIDRFCSEKDETTLKLFANFLLTKVYVVFVTTASLKSAYRLFNVLNARGMQLSNADLIKNGLFDELGTQASRSKELEERWIELEETVGIEQMDQFLGHHRTVHVAAKARHALKEEYDPIIAKYKGDPFALIDMLITSAQNYVRIQSVDFDDAKAKRSLTSLQKVLFDDWVPALLAYLNHPVDGLGENDFIDWLEKITIQNWVRRLAFTARQTVYFNLIKEIKNAPTADKIRLIIKESANNREFMEMISGEVYGKPFAKAVLLRLEQANDDESVTKNYSGKITIEHVLPQALKEEYWQKRFDEDQHQTWLHRLGNLALLQGTKNYKAQYFDFDRKKKIYAKKNDKVSFDTTKELLSLPEWNIEELSARHQRMTDKAKLLWSIDL